MRFIIIPFKNTHVLLIKKRPTINIKKIYRFFHSNDKHIHYCFIERYSQNMLLYKIALYNY